MKREQCNSRTAPAKNGAGITGGTVCASLKNRQKKVKEVTSIVCNKCGRVIPVIEGVPQEDVLSVDKRWGYFSDKDNRMDHF